MIMEKFIFKALFDTCTLIIARDPYSDISLYLAGWRWVATELGDAIIKDVSVLHGYMDRWQNTGH